MHKLRVAIYVRVSTVEQAIENYSISSQTEKLKLYCQAKDWHVQEVYTDGGFTGANMERPALKKMTDDISKDKIDLVLVYKLDRLSRSQKDTLILLKDVFEPHNVGFVSMQENFDTSTAFGRATVGILSVFAELEREQIKDRMRFGREGRAKDGLYHGGKNVPFGYKYIDKELVIDDFESSLVKEIFSRYLNGESAGSICRDMAVKCPQHLSFKTQGANVITTLLSRSVYVGMMKFNDNEYQGQHDPIIEKDVFDKVQEILKQNERYNFHNSESDHLLTGLLFCKKCGARYSHIQRTHRRNGHEYVYQRYACYSRSRLNKQMVKVDKCWNKIWNADDLEQTIKAEILKLQFDKSFDKKAIKMNLDNTTNYEKQIKAIDSQINNLIDLYSVEGININLIQTKVKALNEQRESLVDSIRDNKANNQRQEEFKNTLQTAQRIFEHGSFKEQRLLVSSLIDKIELDDEHVFIHWNF